MTLLRLKRAFSAVATVLGHWSDDRCSSMSAAVAFYAAFSLAPMLVVIIAVAGFFFGPEAVQGRLYSDIADVVGNEGATALQAMVASAWKSDKGSWVAWTAALATAVGASATFAELNSALNVIWRIKAPAHAMAALIKVRLMSFGLVVGIGFLVVVLLVADAVLTYVTTWFFRGAGGVFLAGLQRLVSFFFLCFAFATLIKVLPDATVLRREAMAGGVTSALLFSGGKYLFAKYLAFAGTANAFGAASSLAVLMMWLFFSAAVFMLGAEVAARRARQTGSDLGKPGVPKAKNYKAL